MLDESEAMVFVGSVISEWQRKRSTSCPCRPHAILLLSNDEIETVDLFEFDRPVAVELVRRLRRLVADRYLLLVFEGEEHSSVIGVNGTPISIGAPSRTFGLVVWGPGGFARRFSGPIGPDDRIGDVRLQLPGEMLLGGIDITEPTRILQPHGEA